MASQPESDDLILANRMVSYADAIVAVAFLGVSGIGVVIADPDTRCVMAGATGEIAIGTLLNGVLFLAIVAGLRRAELDLRAGHERSAKVTRYGRMLHVARYVVIGVSSALSLLLLSQADDFDCGAIGEDEIAAETRAAD